jgi:hypothetical protein
MQGEAERGCVAGRLHSEIALFRCRFDRADPWLQGSVSAYGTHSPSLWVQLGLAPTAAGMLIATSTRFVVAASERDR